MSGTPGASADDVITSESDMDMDFEPGSEVDTEDLDNEDFIERLIERGELDYHIPGQFVEDGEDDEDEDEDEDDADTEDGNQQYIEIEVEEEAPNGGETEDERTTRQRRQVMRLLANSELGRLFFTTARGGEFDDDDDNADFQPLWTRNRRRAKPDPNRFPKVPSDIGRGLMISGTFGVDDIRTEETDDRTRAGKKKLAMRILQRELAQESHSRQKLNHKLMAQDMIPSSNADIVIHYDQPVYSGQFSDDGNFFFSVNKDYKVRMYDTSNPYKWRYYKTVEYPFGQWTLTDASLSPDNKYLAYTSIASTVCLAPTDPNDMGDPYTLELAERRGNNLPIRSRHGGSFGIWSIRFSGDGRELVAGASGGNIVVYDIESRTTLHRISGHDDDVNAVCFADKSSPHILYSGSDDTFLKVWDTRSMGDSRAAGAFVGHIEGITYIDSKMDGRYILSNGKEQSMKLWDLRMVMASEKFNSLPSTRRGRQTSFDYRWGAYDDDDWYADPNDNSLVTFRGHRVLRTLIRCHFSPPGSTNSRYVYSGSEDGKVYIWNMDATLAGVVDAYSATKDSRPPTHAMGGMGWRDEDVSQSGWRTCVRDAAWHPNAPIIVASAWSGYGMESGTCSVHSWNDKAEEDEADPKMGISVNQKLVQLPAYDPSTRPQMPNRHRRGIFRRRVVDDE